MERPKKGFFYSTGKNRFVGPWKRMWMEIPHMPFFGIQAALSVAFASFMLMKYYEPRIGLQSKYTVFRPDDPLVKLFKTKMEP